MFCQICSLFEKYANVSVMDTGIVTHLSPLTSVYTLSNLPLCSFPLIILLYPTIPTYYTFYFALFSPELPSITCTTFISWMCPLQLPFLEIAKHGVAKHPFWECPMTNTCLGLSKNVQECSRIIRNVLPNSKVVVYKLAAEYKVNSTTQSSLTLYLATLLPMQYHCLP